MWFISGEKEKQVYKSEFECELVALFRCQKIFQDIVFFMQVTVNTPSAQ